MRVLMLSWEYPPLIVGGLGRHVDALSRELASTGHEVCVVTRGGAGLPDGVHDGVRVRRWAAVAKRTAALYAGYEDERVRITRAGAPTATP